MASFSSWFNRYEQRRVDPYNDISKLTSSRFDLEGLSWNEIREIPVPEMGKNFGETFQTLKRSWRSYKEYKKEDGFADPALCLQILRLQKWLGLPLAEFPELEVYGEGWVDQELAMEEQNTTQVEDEGLSPQERQLIYS